MAKRSTLVLVALMALLAFVPTAVAVAASTATGKNGNVLSVDLKMKPKKLSKKAATPATLEFTAKIKNNAGAPVPLTREVIDFDKSGTLFTKGLATCAAAKLRSVDPPGAKRTCGAALVGSGHLVFEMAGSFIVAGGPAVAEVLAFNGAPTGGKPTILLYAYTTRPLMASATVTGVVSKFNKQGFGSRFSLDFPAILGGSGAVTEFKLTLGKQFTHKGKKRNLISAKCPSGKLKARAAMTYADGETTTVTTTRNC